MLLSTDSNKVTLVNRVATVVKSPRSLDGTTLKDTRVRIAVKGGPAAIRTADR